MAFNYVCDCVSATASCVVLCHLLNTFCLPILLYGLVAISISNANLRTYSQRIEESV